MRISAIAAMSENRAIGKDNQLLWHLPADLQHFKAITLGHPILMGRKTYQSIGRPLPGRRNIILTHDRNFHAEGCIVVDSIDAALAAANDAHELFIIGGAALYQTMLPFIDRIYLTIVHQVFEGDVYFPVINPHEWKSSQPIWHASDEKNKYAFSFVTLDKITDGMA